MSIQPQRFSKSKNVRQIIFLSGKFQNGTLIRKGRPPKRSGLSNSVLAYLLKRAAFFFSDALPITSTAAQITAAIRV